MAKKKIKKQKVIEVKKSALTQLIGKGVIIFYPWTEKNKKLFGDGEGHWWLSEQFKNEFFSAAEKLITAHGEIGAECSYREIVVKINQLPIEHQQARYLEIIKNEIDKQSGQVLLLDDEYLKNNIDDYFDYEELLIFHNSGNSCDMLKNQFIKESIEATESVSLIKKLNNDYNKLSGKPLLEQEFYKWPKKNMAELTMLYQEIEGVLFKGNKSQNKFIDIFSEKAINEPMQVQNTRLLVYFLKQLHIKYILPENWQTIAENKKYFKSTTSKIILKSDLSGALRDINRDGNPKYTSVIADALKKVSYNQTDTI